LLLHISATHFDATQEKSAELLQPFEQRLEALHKARHSLMKAQADAFDSSHAESATMIVGVEK